MLVAPPAGGEGAAEPPAQVDTAVQDCLRDLGGQDPEACDRARVMTREAALCITRSQQFAEGTAPWKAGITYHYGERRIVWNVQNLLEDDGHGAQRGEYLRLDALHGALLGSGAWGATP
ncbi:MAG: hypothetical protein IT371_23010 [Deltaproteobacteria bacterium]|nr:hypothetical protein [Deltaproteobacteria bacterium]